MFSFTFVYEYLVTIVGFVLYSEHYQQAYFVKDLLKRSISTTSVLNRGILMYHTYSCRHPTRLIKNNSLRPLVWWRFHMSNIILVIIAIFNTMHMYFFYIELLCKFVFFGMLYPFPYLNQPLLSTKTVFLNIINVYYTIFIYLLKQPILSLKYVLLHRINA